MFTFKYWTHPCRISGSGVFFRHSSALAIAHPLATQKKRILRFCATFASAAAIGIIFSLN
jgi:hypothetical protein